MNNEQILDRTPIKINGINYDVFDSIPPDWDMGDFVISPRQILKFDAFIHAQVPAG